jgi:cysteinyl-tRNA synthetase
MEGDIMYIYNTLTRKVEKFIPREEGKVKMYTCGPTVYSYAHVGNMRNYIGHDILEKTLKYLGYEVTRCMNITDVGHLTSDSDSGEDKMLKASKKEKKSSYEIADFYTKAFFKDCELLNINKPQYISKATDNIDEYIKIITKLLEKGYAYESGGNIYFDTTKLDDYYVLTNHKEDEMVVGVREGVEEDYKKKNQNDFVLWFTNSKFENHELMWDSPFGKGYPGWHIECSAIAIKYLGEYLDIHCGAIDNIFPHHTNEIAQSESYLGHNWCNYWIHNEWLLDETGKISKSKGAILTISKLYEEGYNPLAFRFMCLNSHYKKQLVFSYDALKKAEETLNKLKNKILSITTDNNYSEDDFNKYNDIFKKALSDNINTSNAITILYDVLKADIGNNTKLKLIESFDKVLSLDLLKKNKIDVELEDKVNKLIEERNNYKNEKNYEKADELRNEINKLGFDILDTKEGTKAVWRQ